jgi:hypothetical protein
MLKACDELSYHRNLHLQKPKHCALLFFGACGVQNSRVEDTSGTRQWSGRESQHNNEENICWFLCMISAVEPTEKNA